MPLFSKKKKSNWVDLTRKQYHQQVNKLPEFTQLKRLIGNYAEDTFEAQLQKWGGHVSYMRNNKDNFLTGEKKIYQHEVNNVLAAHYHFGDMMNRARGGRLRGTLRDNPKAPGDYGANDDDTELMKAAKWIVNSSNTLANSADDPNAPVNRSKIHAAMQHVVQNMDVRSVEALKYLHRHLVNQQGLSDTRGPSLDVKYCSTGGARYLQVKAAEMARGISQPDDGDAKWDDLACYMLGAHMRAHGFTDGNGRAVRGLFACVLLKGNRDLVVPEADFEKSLHKL